MAIDSYDARERPAAAAQQASAPPAVTWASVDPSWMAMRSAKTAMKRLPSAENSTNCAGTLRTAEQAGSLTHV